MTIQLKQLVEIPVDGVHIEGVLELPANAIGIVLFAHGSGSSRRSPRNNFVARVLREHGIGTLLMDLLLWVLMRRVRLVLGRKWSDP